MHTPGRMNWLSNISYIVLVGILTLGISPLRAADLNLKMGNPSKATADSKNKNNYLMVKPYFTLSYNNKKGTPNWVSWRLVKSDIGTAKRVEFYPDESLPQGFKRVTPTDYSGSGFDRGHMCPHSDRSTSDTASKATFVMTNMIPQSPNVNQKAWDQLEQYCRGLANQGKILYIVDGPYGKGGTGTNGKKTVIGKNTVTVPSKCWKVIMVLNANPHNGAEKIDKTTRLIAVIMPNKMSVGEDWASHRFAVADVEKLTGYSFFTNAPAAVMTPLKKKKDRTPIPASKPIAHGD